MELTQEKLALALMPREIKFYETVQSTNDIAKEWLQQGASQGATVIADEQTHGRGRHGRVWHTPPGTALALSVILRSHTSSIYRLNMVAALAVAQMLDLLQVENVTIKWPNDVLVGGKKVCGILPEAVWMGDTLDGVVLGMGVNVRNDFPDAELSQKAISIESALGRSVDRVSLLAVLLFQFDQWLEHVEKPELLSAYAKRMTMLGQTVQVQQNNGDVIEGVAKHVNEQGGLVLQVGEQEIVVMAGDVTVLSMTE